MFQLYSILKDCNEPFSLDKIDITSAKRQLNWKAKAEYLEKLKKSLENIKKAFQNQHARAIVGQFPLAIHHLQLINYDRDHGTRRSSSNYS